MPTSQTGAGRKIRALKKLNDLQKKEELELQERK